MADYWYNVNTHQVEKGAQSDYTQLLGPFDTEAEAQQALAKVKANNDAWDAGEDD
ncbi:SPOR domain-containing protein [Tersicoccus sp. MR15.9]|uniref:SPOR domain-containing protein n=1 Tax=Tersicoccus mangrovi TaxID=3121635 RepID=UPI002FE69509